MDGSMLEYLVDGIKKKHLERGKKKNDLKGITVKDGYLWEG